MDKFARVVDAIQHLQRAFEAAGLAPPSIGLGAAGDEHILAALAAPMLTKADPTLKREITISGTRVHRARAGKSHEKSAARDTIRPYDFTT